MRSALPINHLASETMPAPVRASYNFGSSFLFDAIIVGGGPAGFSAALALARQQHPTIVFNDFELFERT